MKVKTLKKYLENLPDESIVYLSSDEEGNNYSELSEDIEATGNCGAVILYPLHERVTIEYGYCEPCNTNQIIINGECAVCAQSPL